MGEIRTHGTLSGSAVFKTAALNHSATTPPDCKLPNASGFRKSPASRDLWVFDLGAVTEIVLTDVGVQLLAGGGLEGPAEGVVRPLPLPPQARRADAD